MNIFSKCISLNNNNNNKIIINHIHRLRCTCYRHPQNAKDENHFDTKNPQQTSIPLCSINDVQLRFLCPDDLEEVRTLCQDWFPIDYPFSWYQDITSSTRFYALAAIYNLTIIGLIVAEIKPYARLNKEV